MIFGDSPPPAFPINEIGSVNVLDYERSGLS